MSLVPFKQFQYFDLASFGESLGTNCRRHHMLGTLVKASFAGHFLKASFTGHFLNASISGHKLVERHHLLGIILQVCQVQL